MSGGAPGPDFSFYAVGGRQRRNAFEVQEWHQYGEAAVFAVHPGSGPGGCEPRIEVVARYVSPPEVCAAAESPSITFKAATVVADRLYACTQTEVLVYQLPGFERLGYVSLPWFNDLHHVRPRANGHLLVANTGLDMVLEVTAEGEVVELWNVLGKEPWERFDRQRDYRLVVTTKPHQAHPNYVFELGEEVWVTRFEQRDAICLNRPDRRLEIGYERVHDGVVVRDAAGGDAVYFTTVDGRVVIVDASSGQQRDMIDLNALSPQGGALGWCRGLEVLDADTVLVGFSRLRPTRFRQNLRWVKHQLGLGKTALLPTRAALYDLKGRRLLWQVDLEQAGLNAVFSLHRAQPVPASCEGGGGDG